LGPVSNVLEKEGKKDEGLDGKRTVQPVVSRQGCGCQGTVK